MEQFHGTPGSTALEPPHSAKVLNRLEPDRSVATMGHPIFGMRLARPIPTTMEAFVQRIAHLVLGGLLVTLCALERPAHASVPTLTIFEAVDAVKSESGSSTTDATRYIRIRGLVQGESTPRIVSIATSEECARFAVLSMSKPGVYLLALEPGQFTYCTLSRR